MNNKEQFKSWALNNLMDKSGSVSSYITSLDWLSDRFYENGKINKKSIFEVENINLITELHSEVKKIQRDKNSYIYNKNAPSYGKKYFYSASLNKYKEFLQYKNRDTAIEKPIEPPNVENIKFDINSFINNCNNSGIIYPKQFITRFVASLAAKSFVILTGLSGSGKTKLAQAFVQWICQDESQYRIIPVGADWTNREPLLGYPNALDPDDYVKPYNGVIDLMIKAEVNPLLPYFLVLDEMNLSHVERYFADFLSVMESNEEIPLHDGVENKNGVPSKLKLPSNLFIIGTVNIDETTNMFSPKVLDRANTIEFRIDDSEMEGFLKSVEELDMEKLYRKGAIMAENFVTLSKDKSTTVKEKNDIIDTLLDFFGELKKTGAEFGYRTATEIMRLIYQLTKLEQNNAVEDRMSTNEKIDIVIIQKLLPKLHGSRRKLCPILEILGGFCVINNENIVKDIFENEKFDFKNKDVKYPLSLEKITRMYNGAIDNGFTSFAEA